MQFFAKIRHQYIAIQILTTLLVFSLPLQAQKKTSIVTVSSNEGLPSDEIKKVFQDTEGFIWFATPEGLIRYDGYEFKIYSTSNYLAKGLITNNFTDIAQDSFGNLWCATDHGVAKLDCKTETFSFFNSRSMDWKSQEYDLINAIAVDTNNRIWIGTAGNGVLMLPQSDSKPVWFSNKTEGLNMTSNWITKVYCDSKNNIWICSWEGDLTLVNIDKRIQVSWSGLNSNISFVSNSPFSIHEANNNKYWLGLWGKGIVEFKLEKNLQISQQQHINEQIIKESPANENIVYDVDIDSEQNLWLGTPNGVLQVKNPESKTPDIERLSSKLTDGRVPQYEAFSVLCDNAGLIWAGTMAGVSIIDRYTKIFTPYTIPEFSNTISSQAVTAFTKDPWGRLLIGVRSFGFGSYNTETQDFTPFTQLKPYSKLNPELNTINCFFWDNSGYLWLGTRYLGLIKLDPKTGNSIEINATNKQFDFDAELVQDIIQDQLGNIWVGTDRGVFKIIPYKPVGFDNFSIVKYTNESNNPLSLSSNRISKIIEDSQHHLWISTFDKGINRLTSDIQTHLPVTFQRYTVSEGYANGLTSDQVMTMFEDSQKNVWIGTAGGGLLKWTESSGEFHPIKEVKEVIGDAIFSINEDKDANLWLATNQGLTMVNFAQKQPRYNCFKQINGLQSNNFIKGAVYRDREKRLYFGGNKGFNYFDPQTVNANPFIPPVGITEIRVMNQTHEIPNANESLILSHTENSFSVTFSALSFSQPLSNKYATKLQGVDDEWRTTDASMRTVTYANLKPGNYTLYIKASNSNGIWNTTPQTLKITVNPAPYATWWAFTIYFIIIVSALFYVIYKERKNTQIKQALEIEHLEHEKSEKLIRLKKQLFANISNEFITPLNILSVFIENWKQKKAVPLPQDLTLAQRNINRLIRFNKQFLYYSTAEFNQISLSVEQSDLQTLANDICDSFNLLMDKKEIDFTKEINFNDRQVWFDVEKIDIILYNILSHTVKSTAAHGSISFKLTLQTEQDGDYASFNISNTGIHPADENEKALWDTKQDGNDFSGTFGIGLAITQQMIELHHGELQIQNTQPQSSTLSFKIPVSKKAYPPEAVASTKTKTASVDFLKNQVTVEEEVLTNLKNLTKNLSEKHTILIVEQDADLRRLLKTQLSPFFNIKEATNGQTAWTFITNHSIELIISDVTVPAISGIDLCKKVKTSNNKNYVPIILLSGQVSEEERAACYMAGADSYISKPFNINTLLVRMQSLIQQRAMFANLSPAKGRMNIININDLTKSDKFLNEVKEVVEKNMSDPNFSVKQLATALNVSNSMLYRKLSELIDINPNAFIKKMRLIKATELLEETDLSISEIAFKCGFSDISYFGYAFKKDFGISPSAYQRNILQS
jgi:ligand-binding sensor domain-containing protein/signal transduction histidine kinase/DNA-binding response OmpR family regulator